jgi:hypothetical protein
MIVNYECGCFGSGDNVTLNCPFHNKKIKHEKIYPAAEVERLVEAAEELISAQELVNTEGEKQLKLRSAGPLLQLVRAFAKLKAALAALKGE